MTRSVPERPISSYTTVRECERWIHILKERNKELTLRIQKHQRRIEELQARREQLRLRDHQEK